MHKVDEKVIRKFFIEVLYNTILELRANAAMNGNDKLFKAMNMMHNLPRALSDDSDIEHSFEWFSSWFEDEELGEYLVGILNKVKNKD